MKNTLLIVILLITAVSFGQTYEGMEFYKSGKPKSYKTYKESNGKYELVKSINVYENGQKKEEKTYKGVNRYGVPIKDGIWTEWYENGQKYREGTYKDGNIVGIWTSWTETGEMERKRTILEYLIKEATAEKDAAEARTKELAAELAVAWSKKGEKEWEGTILNYLIEEAIAEKVAIELAIAEEAARKKAAINKVAKDKSAKGKAAREKAARKKAARKKAAREKVAAEKILAEAEEAKAEAEKAKAEARYKELAVKLASDCLKIFDLSQELYKSGKHQETMDILETTLRMEGCDEEINSKAFYLIGWNYANDQGALDTARAIYQKVVDSFSPGLKYVDKAEKRLAGYKINDLSVAAYDEGNFEDALVLREQVVMEKGFDKELKAKNQYFIGYIYQYKLEEPDKAKEAYRKVGKIHSKSKYVDKAEQKLATL
jgi:hypothetical protein